MFAYIFAHFGSEINFSLSKGLKIKILLKKFHILAFWGPKYGLMLDQKWQKSLFSDMPPQSQPSFP